ncbi:MAG: glutaredoxin family protein [Methylococcales bacterium]|jgi:hypothetical protein
MMKLMLFGTLACHLCEEAENIIAACQQGVFEIELIDIAVHEQWQEKYAVKIPVLYHPETETELGWPFGQEQVQAFINELSHD